MKISLDWLKDYVALPEDLDISKIAYDLTMSTVEVEGAEHLSEKFEHMVLGQISEVLPHPNADRLKVCRTDVGGEIKEIVCGGINLRDGMKVAVAKPGAMVRWHGEGEPVEIKNAKLRGVESYGMICASSEIGLFDLFPFEEDATIIDLSDFDAAPGTPLHKALGLDDVILEIDNKSLTNRPDLWGHYGMARELSALYDLPMKELPVFTASVPEKLKVVIDDPDRCTRYLGLKIENVSTKPASFKIQSRVWRVGMRPINALVDITNYVMLAVGQPTHAFDFNNIAGGITVRRARSGEKLSLLNGRELTLTGEDLVIADDEEAVALAGVMGGSKDSILEKTTNVILEIANFTSLGVRRTSTRFDVRTEASIRYEKGMDPQRVDGAIGLSAALFAEEFPEMKLTAMTDNYPKPLSQTRVTVSLDWLARRTGKRLPESDIEKMLKRLGFEVVIEGDELRVVSPSWRSTGDISLPDDIMEEVARLHGYENYEPTPITTSFQRAINQREYDLERGIREYLSFRCGMREIFTYPWMKDEFIAAAAISTEDALQIATPPAPTEKYVRTSNLPNLLEAVAKNLRFADAFALYEMTQIFFGRDYTSKNDPREKLPLQKRSLAGAITDRADEYPRLFRSAKGIVEHMARNVHMEPLAFAGIQPGNRPGWADETACLAITKNDVVVGCVALLSKKSALSAGIKQAAVAIFELDVDALKPLDSRTNRFSHLPEFPQVEYDISMIFDEKVTWQEVSEAASKGQNLVKSVSFVDEYRGRQIPQGKKSITLRLIIGADDKTLTSEEIEKTARAVERRLEHQMGGTLRGE
ncbi:MAG: phenylalanine--tRNA ligase subunit beta [Synergistaceae bacterium]|jgi:phenylalanyl-tRNA synthetase beta chain|nr:phenylalanine--tRNA ligase subunit beta [Synergistaceae bacterium]